MFILLLLINTMAYLLSIASYNSHGSGTDRMEYIKELINEYTFLCVQEHWLFEHDLNIYSSNIDGISFHGCSEMNNKELRTGRPSGGCVILWHSNFNGKVTPVETSSNRLCVVNVEFKHYIIATF